MTDEPDPRTVTITGTAHATIDVFAHLRGDPDPTHPTPDEPAPAGGSD